MKKAKSYEGLTVRVPINMGRELRKLKAEKDLSSMGSALQIYIENMKIERIEERLGAVEATVKKHTKQIDLMLDRTIKHLENIPGIIVEKLRETDEFLT